MGLPSKEVMSMLGTMAKNYGSRNAMGLGMFTAGGLATIAAGSSRKNQGTTAGNTILGMAGLGMMGYGGHKLGAQRLFSAAGRQQLSGRVHGLANQYKFMGHHTTAKYGTAIGGFIGSSLPRVGASSTLHANHPARRGYNASRDAGVASGVMRTRGR